MLVSILTGTVFLFFLVGLLLIAINKYDLAKRKISPCVIYKPLLVNIILLGFILSVTDESFQKPKNEVATFNPHTPLEFPLSSNIQPFNKNPLTSNYDDVLTRHDAEREILDPIKQEVFNNFENLAITIRVLESGKPKDFSESGLFHTDHQFHNFHDTQLTHLHSPRNYQETYHLEVKNYINSLSLYSAFYEENKQILADDPELSLLTSDIYQRFHEVIATLQQYEENLDQIMSLNLANAETSRRSISMHDQKINRAKISLAHAAASFSLTLDAHEDAKQLEKYLNHMDFDITLAPGGKGYSAAMGKVESYTVIEQNLFEGRVSNEPVAQHTSIAKTSLPPSKEKPSSALSPEIIDTTFAAAPPTSKVSITSAGLATLSPNKHDENNIYDSAIVDSKTLTQSGKIGFMVEKVAPFTTNDLNTPSLATGDVIVTLDGQFFQDPFEFSDSLKNQEASNLTLGIMRNKKLQEIGIQGNELEGAQLVPMLLDQKVKL